MENVRVEHPLPSKHYINQKLLGDGVQCVLPHDWVRSPALQNAMEFASGFVGIMQLTGGSSSVRAAWEPMRSAGATARAMLLEAAASLWQVDVNRLVTKAGKVVDPATGRTFAYGALARWAASIELSPVTPKNHRPFRLIGTSARRVDTPDKVNGKARFGIDVKKDGMLYAAVRSAPALSGRLDRFDPADFKLPEGVERFVKVDDRTVAAVADSYWTAQRALQDLSLRFEDRGTAFSSKSVLTDFTKRITAGGGHAFRNDGDVRMALAPPRKVIEAEYTAPYLAHACMEPTAFAGCGWAHRRPRSSRAPSRKCWISPRAT
jgi:isoquinoline 1-oxidoreductase beta subunit